jgi:hypothetical protein
MNRFMVFWGDQYHPQGGFKDDHTSFEAKEEAIGFARGVAHETLKWSHVVDLESFTIIEEF